MGGLLVSSLTWVESKAISCSKEDSSQGIDDNRGGGLPPVSRRGRLQAKQAWLPDAFNCCCQGNVAQELVVSWLWLLLFWL